jgi:hypothetical protein
MEIHVHACLHARPSFARCFAGSGGVVSCLDEGPYFEGFVTTIPFTLDCRGVVYAVGSSFTLSVNAVVTFRHVIFDGAVGGGIGVQIQGGKVVFEDCTFQNFTASPGEAIQFAPSSGQARLFVTDSLIHNNGGVGIAAAVPAGVTGSVVLDNVRLENNLYGIAVTTGTSVVINRSVVSGNSTAGVEGDGGSQIVVNNSTISHNGVGAQGTSSIRLSNNDIAFNNTAISGNTGTFGNNRFSGNGSPGTPLTPLGGASSDFGQQ